MPLQDFRDSAVLDKLGRAAGYFVVTIAQGLRIVFLNTWENLSKFAHRRKLVPIVVVT
jgi:hypothetical protein